ERTEMLLRLLLVVLLFGVSSISSASAPAPALDRWPQFRGPESMGINDDPALPDTWSATQNVVWKTPVAGVGWLSPIVWGDRIYLTSAVNTDPNPEAPKKGLYFGGERKDINKFEHKWMVY